MIRTRHVLLVILASALLAVSCGECGPGPAGGPPTPDAALVTDAGVVDSGAADAPDAGPPAAPDAGGFADGGVTGPAFEFCRFEADCISKIGLGCGRSTIMPWQPVRASNGALLVAFGAHHEICACMGMTLPSVLDYADWAQTHGAVGQVSGAGPNVQSVEYSVWWQPKLPSSAYEARTMHFDATGFVNPFSGPEFVQPSTDYAWLFWTSDILFQGEVEDEIQFWPRAPQPTWFFQSRDTLRYDGHVMCVPKTPARRRVQSIGSAPTRYTSSPFLAGGETCATATPLTAGTTVNGTLVGAQGDHQLLTQVEDRTSRCGDSSAYAADVAYRVVVPPARTLTVIVQADDARPAVSLLDDADKCLDLGQCLAGAYGFGRAEVSWTNPAASANEVIVLLQSSRETHFEITTRLD